MVFDIGAGLAQMGDMTAKFAGQGMLQSQKDEQDKIKLQMANDFAVQRQQQEQDFRTSERKDTEKFTAAQSEKTLAAQKEFHQISAGAVTASAASHERAARYTADKHLEGLLESEGMKFKIAKLNTENRIEVAKVRGEIAQQLRTAGLMSDDAVKQEAEVAKNIGEIPSDFGYGGTADRMRVKNELFRQLAEDGVTPAEWSARKGQNTGIKAALTQNEKMTSAIEAFSNTAGDAGNILKDLIQKNKDALGPTGAPILDRLIQAAKQEGGNDAVVKLTNVIATYRTETAKVLSGNMGNVSPTDQSIRHVDEQLNRAMNAEQMLGAMQYLDLERQSRKNNLHHQRETLTTRLQGKSEDTVVKPPTPLPDNPQGAFSLPDKVEDFVDNRVYNTTSGARKFKKGIGLVPVQ